MAECFPEKSSWRWNEQAWKDWKLYYIRTYLSVVSVNNWYPAFTGCPVNVTGLENSSQVTLALTASGLSLLNNSLLKTNQPPHSVKRWSLSRVWCELHEDNVVKLFARDRDTTGMSSLQISYYLRLLSMVAYLGGMGPWGHGPLVLGQNRFCI